MKLINGEKLIDELNSREIPFNTSINNVILEMVDSKEVSRNDAIEVAKILEKVNV